MLRLFLLLMAGVMSGQAIQRVELTLERKKGNGSERIEPNLVLQQGDLVRFRVTTNFSGYLYVLNLGTSGRYTLLFPKPESGMENAIVAGREYVIPATSAGWYRVEGPAGQEQVYWVVSPVRLEAESAPVVKVPEQAEGARDGKIVPRCDDSLFRARGACLDEAAGAHELDEVPEPIRGAALLRKRDLAIVKGDRRTTLVAEANNRAPLVYVFRLAHQ